MEDLGMEFDQLIELQFDDLFDLFLEEFPNHYTPVPNSRPRSFDAINIESIHRAVNDEKVFRHQSFLFGLLHHAFVRDIFNPHVLIEKRKKDNSRTAQGMSEYSNLVYAVIAEGAENTGEVIRNIAYIGAGDVPRPKSHIEMGVEMLSGFHVNLNTAVATKYGRQVITTLVADTLLKGHQGDSIDWSYFTIFKGMNQPTARFFEYCLVKHAAPFSVNIELLEHMIVVMKSAINGSAHQIELLDQLCHHEEITYFVAMHGLARLIRRYNNRVCLSYNQAAIACSDLCAHKWFSLENIPARYRPDLPEYHGRTTFIPIRRIDNWFTNMTEDGRANLRDAIRKAFVDMMKGELYLSYHFQEAMGRNVVPLRGARLNLKGLWLQPCRIPSDYIGNVYFAIYNQERIWYESGKFPAKDIALMGDRMRAFFQHKVLYAIRIYIFSNVDHSRTQHPLFEAFFYFKEDCELGGCGLFSTPPTSSSDDGRLMDWMASEGDDAGVVEEDVEIENEAEDNEFNLFNFIPSAPSPSMVSQYLSITEADEECGRGLPPGLYNLGNTCYANCVLQAVNCALPHPLPDFFDEPQYRSLSNGAGGLFSDLIKTMRSPMYEGKSINAEELFNAVELRLGELGDCSEFFQLLAGIFEDTNIFEYRVVQVDACGGCQSITTTDEELVREHIVNAGTASKNNTDVINVRALLEEFYRPGRPSKCKSCKRKKAQRQRRIIQAPLVLCIGINRLRNIGELIENPVENFEEVIVPIGAQPHEMRQQKYALKATAIFLPGNGLDCEHYITVGNRFDGTDGPHLWSDAEVTVRERYPRTQNNYYEKMFVYSRVDE